LGVREEKSAKVQEYKAQAESVAVAGMPVRVGKKLERGDGRKVGDKDVAERDRKVNEIREITAIGKNGGPLP
jgi:hypothetical protein